MTSRQVDLSLLCDFCTRGVLGRLGNIIELEPGPVLANPSKMLSSASSSISICERISLRYQVGLNAHALSRKGM